MTNDNLDKAAELQQILNDAAVERVRRQSIPATNPNFDGQHCVGCGDEIPEGRRALGKVLCIYCQELKEKNARA